MLYIFDLDDTLVLGYVNGGGFDEVKLLPGRKKKLSALQTSNEIAIVTNQGGVAFGYHTEAQVWIKLHRVLEELGLPHTTPIAVCFDHPKATDPRYNNPAEIARRKPSGAMIKEIMADTVEVYALNGVLYVGDRPDDFSAAADAGVNFMWTKEFFGDA